MAEDEIQNEKDEFSGKSASQLTRELLRLIFVLIWRFLVWVFKRILKGILWCMQAIEEGSKRLNDWWHDTNTQQKVAKNQSDSDPSHQHRWRLVCQSSESGRTWY